MQVAAAALAVILFVAVAWRTPPQAAAGGVVWGGGGGGGCGGVVCSSGGRGCYVVLWCGACVACCGVMRSIASVRQYCMNWGFTFLLVQSVPSDVVTFYSPETVIMTSEDFAPQR